MEPRALLQSTRRVAAVLVFVVLAGCTAEAGQVSTGAPSDTAAAPPAVEALAVTEAGLIGVSLDGSVRWTSPAGVAAPDGSAVYAARPLHSNAGLVGDWRLERFDVSTGEVASHFDLAVNVADLRVAAVAPGGDRVVLVAPAEGDTLLLDVDTASATVVHRVVFEGEVDPEAYSLDHTLVFAARSFGDWYHVHVLELATGDQWPTLGRDKSKPPEEMYGNVVQAVLSPDGTQLATLYRDPVSPGHTAFVHLLSLVGGTTVCIDLHEPVGTGPLGSDAIVWGDDGIVRIGHMPVDGGPLLMAMFEPAAIWDGPVEEHYHAWVTRKSWASGAPAVPDGLRSMDGFRRLVALL